MYRNFKVSVVIPAGRRKHLKILCRYLEINKDIVDEVQVWRNTEDEEDLNYIDSLNGPFFRVRELPPGVTFDGKKANGRPIQYNTGQFYVYTVDPETIYIRLDDDICWLDENFFKNLLDYRIDNPDYFLVFGNIWNNAIVSYLQQKAGHIPEEYGQVKEPFCMEETAWKDVVFALYIHRILKEKIATGKTDELYIPDHPLTDYTRFSVSAFAFFGKDFAEFKGKTHWLIGESTEGGDEKDEEIWLTRCYPKRLNRLNVICGNALCCHFSFFSQRKALEAAGTLEYYDELSKKIYSDKYYKLLGESQ